LCLGLRYTPAHRYDARRAEELQVSSSNLEDKQLLEVLTGPNAERGWCDFLSAYSDLIYATIRHIAHDHDHLSDCFLFICEKLADRDFRRLRAFAPDGRATFSTWLRAVVRNLSLDWYRSQFGRARSFGRVASCPAIDQEIFAAVFERKMSLTEAWREVTTRGTELPFKEFERKVNGIRQMLTSRQVWLLCTSARGIGTDFSEPEPNIEEIADTAPNPESLALLRQTQHKVRSALRELSGSERLLLRLRFDEELGLRELAAVVGLKDAQTADRRIRETLAKLREKLGIKQPLSGKTRPASV
jgi:RNA polymerase sigma factor (sigma-70 family)